MCGILYCESSKGTSVSNALIKRYKNQSSRGTEGFAFVGIDSGKTKKVERFMYEYDFLNNLRNDLSNSILAHHRLPTSTVNIPEATHPIIVANDSLKYNYYVVHNGVINNSDDLRKEHEKLGFKYTTIIKNVTTHESNGKKYVGSSKETFNDSESLAIELAMYIENKSDRINTRGSVAFICIQTNKNGKAIKLYFGHNGGNPLIMEDDKKLFCLKSEGHGEKLPSDILYYYSFSDKKRTIYETQVKIGNYYGPHKFVNERKWTKHDTETVVNPGTEVAKLPIVRRDYGDEDYYPDNRNRSQEDLSVELVGLGYERCKDGVWRLPKEDDGHESYESAVYNKGEFDFTAGIKHRLSDGSEDEWYGFTENDLWNKWGDLETEIKEIQADIKKKVSLDEDNYLNQVNLKDALKEFDSIEKELNRRMSIQISKEIK